MQQRDIRLLIIIGVIALFSAWIAWPTDPGLRFLGIDRDIRFLQGLDLQGGMQVLLEADLPDDQEVSADDMEAARMIVENRIDGLGVTEPSVQRVGARRIQVELPGIRDPEAAIATLRETGLMEWIDAGSTYLPAGTIVETDFAEGVEARPGGEDGAPIYRTVLTGRNLRRVNVGFDPTTNSPLIEFELDTEGARIFADHTASNVGRFMAIVLDKEVISSPRIEGSIPDGRGVITGQFTTAEAQSTVLQLRYGALPIPLREIDTREVGPTLGQDSVTKSVRAGIAGLIVVLLFMLTYYRLPGLLAALALVIYAAITMALYKLIPITLTLPGIAGFLLSMGLAVDANILIFERMREELRHGRTLARAIDVGFRRAWTAILDANLSTLITAGILWVFGNSFGASMIKGFALTLAIGVLVSMFTAVLVTRTFVRSVFAATGEQLRERKWLLGV